MNTYTDLFEKAQAEFLTGLRQAQELNLKALATASEFWTKVPTAAEADANGTAKLPTPTEVVERTFAFTNEVLQARKEYMLKLAEIAGQTQKQFVDNAKKVAAKPAAKP
jgi:hypothetical protein